MGTDSSCSSIKKKGTKKMPSWVRAAFRVDVEASEL
jgi:hypothetical protein